MRRASIKVGLAIALLVGGGGIADAQDWEKANDAYVRKDFVTAAREFRSLALHGDTGAQYNLAVMYEDGTGVTQDFEQAIYWYRMAADQGLAQAQFMLGQMYALGKGITQDYQHAVVLYRLSAQQGFSAAQNNLGVMYARGRGVTQDYVYAHMWFNIAASKGEQDAVTNRNSAAERMTTEQIAKAQELARQCVAKNYKGC